MASNKTTVSVVRRTDYDKAGIKAAVDETFGFFGGVKGLLKRGDSVLVKPNFLRKSRPESCTITHPAIIESVVEALLDNGVSPVIGDSPAFGSVSRIAQGIGLDKFAEKHNIDIIELDEPRRVETRCAGETFSLTVSGKALDFDAIINLPKLKAHVQFLFTGAVKNMYGCVSGKRKAWRHFRSNSDMGWYTGMLLANYLKVKPVFTIMDAVMAMEKRGPSGGVPKQVSLLVGGVDCVAIDRVIASILNVDPALSPILRASGVHKIGEQDLNKIEVVGEPLESVKIMDFDFPGLIPVGFNINQVAKSLIKHLWMKRFGRAV